MKFHVPVRLRRGVFCLLTLAALSILGAGCATTEVDSESARPWNTPRGWEHGLPMGGYQSR
jgi:hypothetical protein